MNAGARILTLFTALLVFAVPANARRYRAKGARAKYIDSVLAFRPSVHIGVIREGDQVRYSDSFSTVSRGLHANLYERYAPALKLREVFHTDDSALTAELDVEIISLFLAAEERHYVHEGLDCPLLDSVAKARGMRFVLLLFNSGFVRTKANYAKEDRKSLLPSLVSLGMYQNMPIAAVSNMAGMVLDLREHQTYFYTNAYGHPSPVNIDGLDKQFKELFTTFFWSAPM